MPMKGKEAYYRYMAEKSMHPEWVKDYSSLSQGMQDFWAFLEELCLCDNINNTSLLCINLTPPTSTDVAYTLFMSLHEDT